MLEGSTRTSYHEKSPTGPPLSSPRNAALSSPKSSIGNTINQNSPGPKEVFTMPSCPFSFVAPLGGACFLEELALILQYKPVEFRVKSLLAAGGSAQ